MIAPMREELTRFGVRELRTAGEVDGRAHADTGHGDGRGQLGVWLRRGEGPDPESRLALQHAAKPETDLVATVFAGADIEAT